MKRLSLWESERLTLEKAIALSKESLASYGASYRHWAIAYSGGKDSTTVVTLVATLLKRGEIPPPETLAVLYADTRMELPPLHATALRLLQELEQQGIRTHVVQPEMDERFFVYMLGRGVPPPKNRFRWCTPQLKVEPMEKALAALREQYGEKFLMLTGVRIGESAARDQRIALSCSRDGAECGQGWFQQKPPAAVADTLAPCLHWRVCHVWDWLQFHAPRNGFSSSAAIAEIYGGDEKEEIAARTGCVGCNLASREVALDTLLKQEQWQYLAPLKGLKPLYAELAQAHHRLRKDGSDRRKDGTLAANPMRLGPLTLQARRYGLQQVLAIQEAVNQRAAVQGALPISLINPEELSRIHELIEAGTWPHGWTGSEHRGDEPIPHVIDDGIIQELLFGREEGGGNENA